MTMTMSTTEHNEHLRERWLAEFSGHALAALVDQAMTECPLPDRQNDYRPPRIGSAVDDLRLALEAVIKSHTDTDQRINWAHRLDPTVLDWESFVEREK